MAERVKLDPPLVMTPGPDNPVRLVISRNKIREIICRVASEEYESVGDVEGIMADAIIKTGSEG